MKRWWDTSDLFERIIIVTLAPYFIGALLFSWVFAVSFLGNIAMHIETGDILALQSSYQVPANYHCINDGRGVITCVEKP